MKGFVAAWFLALPLYGAARAQSYEGARQEEADAGVHVPVLTKAPVLLEFIPAEYPKEAQAKGKSGAVKLEITIAKDGTVSDTQVKEPLGDGLDEAAVSAVKRFRFSPAEVDGSPAPVSVEYVYRFELKEEPASAPDGGERYRGARLKGQVLARGSRSRVPGATVRCGDGPQAPEAQTDADGQFELPFQGSCTVRVIADGYLRFDSVEQLGEGETKEVRYYLLAQSSGFETVVRSKREDKEVVRRTLDRQELQKVPGSFGDPIRVLQNFPGVARSPFISGALIVRGATPRQTTTMMDSVSIPLLFHLGGGPSVINSEFLDHIDFFPGGFGARYGRAIGGVVDVATRKGASDTWHGVAKVDLLDASAFIQAPVGDNGSVAAATRRSYVDGVLPIILPLVSPGGSTLRVAPAYWDYQARGDYGRRSGQGGPPSPSTYYVMAFGSDDRLDLVSSGPSQPRDISLSVHTLFHRVKGDWTYRQDRFTNVFTPYLGYDLQAVHFGQIAYNADVYNTGLRDDASVALSRYLGVRFGVDLLFNHLVGWATLPVQDIQYVSFPGASPKADSQRLQRSINTFDGAVYGELDVKLGRFTFTPGFRATYARQYGHDHTMVDPRSWLRFKLDERTTLKGSVGLYSQAPDSTNLERAPFGNPHLGFEKAFQVSAGVERKITDALNLDLVGYFNRRYENVVSPGRTLVNPDGSVIQQAYSNDGLGKSYGMEVLLRHEVTRNFFGWVAYTLSRSESRKVGEASYVLNPFDQTHILTAVASYKLPYGFEIGGRFRYVTGNPRTPLLHPFDIYDSDGNRYFQSSSLTRTARLPPFNQLDVRIDKNFVMQQWTLDVYLDVQNVYNRRNVETTFYDYRFRQEVPVPGIPLLPIIGVRGSF